MKSCGQLSFMQSRDTSQHFPGSAADLRLRFAGGVLVPFLRCRWSRRRRKAPHRHARIAILATAARCRRRRPLASSLPSGLNATPNTPPWGPVAWRGAPTGWPVAGFHSRTVPSAPALASSLPSGLNATPCTPSRAAAGRGGARRRGWPVAGFHSRTVPSPPALASSLPSGLNATPYTPFRAGAGLEGRADGLAGGRVPQPHRAVGAGAGQQLAVGAERHPVTPSWAPAGVEGRADGAGRWPGSTAAPCRRASALASSLPSGLNATPFTPPVALVAAGGVRRRAGRWPGSTAAPCRRRRRWPAACRRG